MLGTKHCSIFFCQANMSLKTITVKGKHIQFLFFITAKYFSEQYYQKRFDSCFFFFLSFNLNIFSSLLFPICIVFFYVNPLKSHANWGSSNMRQNQKIFPIPSADAFVFLESENTKINY